MLAATGSRRVQYEPWILAPFGWQGSGAAGIAESSTMGSWRPMRQLAVEEILSAADDATGSARAWISWLWFAGEPATTAYVDVRQPAAEAAASALAHSPAAAISVVRADLSLSMVELAAALQVERPTIYAWLAGRSEPQERNRQRLQRLFEVARRWSHLSNSPLGVRLRHPDEHGTALLDLLRSGRFEEAESRLDALANTRPAQGQNGKVRNIREVLARHGLEQRIKPSPDEIDRLTGKRSAPE